MAVARNVERSTKNEREAENVVYLVGVVGTSGGDDDVITACLGFFVGDLGIGVGHGENDRILRHGANHLAVDCPFHGQSGEDVGADHGFGQRAQVRLLGKTLLIFVHPCGAAFVDHAFGVAEDDVLALHPQAHIVLGAGDAGGSGAIEDDAHFVDVLADDFESVQKCCAGDDGRPVLVVVEDGNLHRLAQCFFDLEAIRSLDVFQIDPAEGGFEQLAEFDDFFGIVAVDFDVEDVNVGEAFEQNGLAFHDGLSRKSADIAEAKHGGPVAHDCDQVAAGGIFEGIVRILLDLKARLGHAGRVRQTEIALGAAGFGGCDFDLSGTWPIVIIEGLLLAD